MAIPPYRFPPAPPRNHMHFNPEGMVSSYVPHRAGADLFFCHGLEPKSPQAKIMQAAATGDTAQLKNLIIQFPDTPPDFANAHGVTPVMIAAARGDVQNLHMLADHPLVNISAETKDGWTALHYAAYFDRADSVTALLKRQAHFAQTNHAGETAFDLTAEKPEAAAAFHAFKPFIHHMKRAQADHPRLQLPARHTAAAEDIPAAPDIPPAIQPDTENAGTEKADDNKNKMQPMRTHFMRAVLNVGISTETGMNALYQRLQQDILAGHSDTLAEAYDAVQTAQNAAMERLQKIDFKWESLLRTAVLAGNVPAAAFLTEKQAYISEKPLNILLASLIRHAEDTPQSAEMAQWLLRWGADANASAKLTGDTENNAGTLAYQAFSRQKPQIFESLCLCAGELKSWHMTPQQLQWEQRVAQITARHAAAGTPAGAPVPHISALQNGMEILKLRSAAHGLKQSEKLAHASHALDNNNINKLMAVYAEMRGKRGTLSYWTGKDGQQALPPAIGAAAIVLALEQGRTGFAKRLAADGHDLKNLTYPDWQHKLALLAQETATDKRPGPSAIRDFITAQENGTLSLPYVTSIDTRMEALHIAARSSPINPRFGI